MHEKINIFNSYFLSCHFVMTRFAHTDLISCYARILWQHNPHVHWLSLAIALCKLVLPDGNVGLVQSDLKWSNVIMNISCLKRVCGHSSGCLVTGRMDSGPAPEHLETGTESRQELPASKCGISIGSGALGKRNTMLLPLHLVIDQSLIVWVCVSMCQLHMFLQWSQVWLNPPPPPPLILLVSVNRSLLRIFLRQRFKSKNPIPQRHVILLQKSYDFIKLHYIVGCFTCQSCTKERLKQKLVYFIMVEFTLLKLD